MVRPATPAGVRPRSIGTSLGLGRVAGGAEAASLPLHLQWPRAPPAAAAEPPAALGSIGQQLWGLPADEFAKPALSQEGECWLYAPAAVARAPIQRRCRTRAVRFRMWKRCGYLHFHAESLLHPLVLPVFVSDSCGYPCLSSILRTWMCRGSTRWEVFKHYMVSADTTTSAMEANVGDERPQPVDLIEELLADDLPPMTPSFTSEGLDRRFDTIGELKDWVFVWQIE